MNATTSAQRGVALFVALIMLIIVTLLAISAMRSGTLELRMANNYQERTTAFQTAQAVIDAVVDTPANLATVGDVCYTTCANVPSAVPACTPGCTCNFPGGSSCNHPLTMVGGMVPSVSPFSDSGVVVGARTTRLGPLQGPPPRRMGTSAVRAYTAVFRVEAWATVDNPSATGGRGQAQLSQGYMILAPLDVQVTYQ